MKSIKKREYIYIYIYGLGLILKVEMAFEGDEMPNIGKVKTKEKGDCHLSFQNIEY